MIRSDERRTQPSEFVCVIRLVNCYAATHVQGRKKAFVSTHPETDKKIAKTTAKLFAETHSIPYDDTLRELDRPLITVLKHGKDWFPAELHADKVRLLTSICGQMNLGGNQQEATNMANFIALISGADCVPSIGISLDKSQPYNPASQEKN